MKNAILGILLAAALAPAAFAQTWCEQDCCEDAGGSWDSDYEYCESPDSSYYECLSDWCSQDSSGYESSSDVSCCGTGFILAAVGGLVFLRMSNGAVR